MPDICKYLPSSQSLYLVFDDPYSPIQSFAKHFSMHCSPALILSFCMSVQLLSAALLLSITEVFPQVLTTIGKCDPLYLLHVLCGVESARFSEGAYPEAFTAFGMNTSHKLKSQPELADHLKLVGC